MLGILNVEQTDRWGRFKEFAEQRIEPHAADADRTQTLAPEVLKGLAAAGYIGSSVPRRWGGGGMDAVCYGLLSHEIGRVCQSTRNLVAVEDMVCHAVVRAGSERQRDRWLGPVFSGEAVAAFAITEPEVGSDAAAVETTATSAAGGFVLSGHKKWISFGQIADVFLVLTRCEGALTAFLVERDAPGLAVRPIRDLLGLRGSMLAELVFDDVHVTADDMVGPPGAGLAFVGSPALGLGRYSTAWGAVGLAQSCLEASVGHAARRRQHGAPIAEHQLVRRMLADMVTDVSAARLLCHQAGVSVEKGDSGDLYRTLMAKYRSSTVARRAAEDAVQIHGALGVSGESPIERHYRDAKILEIIEGTTQIHQSIIGECVGTLYQVP
ncbi:acyl-CoA dehydrogenase family protein [Actinomadura chokoriensis]|uniref:Acyl-CoA dehydrogenase family protein n=1 Tax=Actinomadura chokoriensis TaxID=454156 RepID=A0ABV4QWR9_9ACTN